MKAKSVLVCLLVVAIMLAIGDLFVATALAAPLAAPNVITLGISHSQVTTDLRPSNMVVSASGAGTVQVVRTAQDGTSDTRTVNLSLSPTTFRSTGNRGKTPTGANIVYSGQILIWSGYNVSHLPCTTGEPSMQLARGASGVSLSVSNPTSTGLWAVIYQTLGGPITDWRPVAPGATVTFTSLPAAATGYAAIQATDGPSTVCSNLGWNFP